MKPEKAKLIKFYRSELRRLIHEFNSETDLNKGRKLNDKMKEFAKRIVELEATEKECKTKL